VATSQSPKTSEDGAAKNVVQTTVELLNTLAEAGYKAQTRSLNVARVLVEAASRQQEHSRQAIAQLANPSLPWYSPERLAALFSVITENQNEALRLGREYIDELNAAAAEGRQTIETIVKQAGKAREAQQEFFSQSFGALQSYAGAFRPAGVEAGAS
jgi:hypothetical protein